MKLGPSLLDASQKATPTAIGILGLACRMDPMSWMVRILAWIARHEIQIAVVIDADHRQPRAFRIESMQGLGKHVEHELPTRPSLSTQSASISLRQCRQLAR